MELFEQIGREYEFGTGTIVGAENLSGILSGVRRYAIWHPAAASLNEGKPLLDFLTGRLTEWHCDRPETQVTLFWLAKNFIGFLKASCEEHT